MTAASTTSTQRAVREARMAATTSGIGPWAAVRRHPAGSGRMDFSSATCARSASSIMCWVPILVARRRPDRTPRRTVSGWRLVRRAASGTVSTVVPYYNNRCSRSQQRTRQAVANGGTQRHGLYLIQALVGGLVGGVIVEVIYRFFIRLVNLPAK